MAFSNSGLATFTHISPFRTSPRNQPAITKIVIHHMAGILTMDQFDSIVHTPGRDMSSNYAIDCNAKIGLFCPEADRSWCSGSAWLDNQAITIETSNSDLAPNWPVSSSVYAKLIELCTDICKRNGIKKLTFTGNTDGSLCFHYMVQNTECPGPFIKARANQICDAVNRRLNDPNYIVTNATDTSSPTAYDYALSGEITSVEPDYTEIKSYITSVNRDTKSTVDYKALKDIGLIGTMIEAGYLYNLSHIKVDTYRSPKLDEQVTAAKKAEVLYGLYGIVRAKNVEEAREELAWLRIYIQKYVPPLGVWLKLELSAGTAMNDMIVSAYYDMLKSAGLVGKVGFYVTRDQLSKLTWSKWQEQFLLWLIDPISDISEIEQILTPEFFMLEKS